MSAAVDRVREYIQQFEGQKDIIPLDRYNGLILTVEDIRDVLAERDALAAVIEKAVATIRHYHGIVDGVDILDILEDGDTAAVLRERDAEKWDEGFDAGERDVFQHETFDEPCVRNPYRDDDPRD